MEREGFLLMDTLVYYARSLARAPIPEDAGAAQVRTSKVGDEVGVREVAAQAFKGYFGHYHADRRLEPARCDEGYVEWAVRSCASTEVADGVLVAEIDGSILGFITLRVNSPVEVDGLLIAVHPSVQGQGIARSLMIGALKWCESRGAERMIISTQINNLSSQKVWARLGFELSHAYYTFHKWFDENRGVTSHAD